MMTMPTRRQILATLAVYLLLPSAWAATPRVEIVAMAHPPVVAALKLLREWLVDQGGMVKVTEVDAESAEGKLRLRAAGFSGHIPILILIDGQYRFARPGGGMLSLVKFPNAPSSPPGMRGDWLIEDARAIIGARQR